MATQKTEKKAKVLTPAQKLAKQITDGIKDKKIVMGKAQKIVGKNGEGKKLSGMFFVSEPLPTKAVVEVRKTETEGAKNDSYTIKLSAKGVTQVFSGGQARRAYNLLTKVPRTSGISGENIRFCEEHLNFLGTASMK